MVPRARLSWLPKTVVPMAHVGGREYPSRLARDLSGMRSVTAKTRGRGARVACGNVPSAGSTVQHLCRKVILVVRPRIRPALDTGKTESHRFDESLKSIDTGDGVRARPMLPLSVVVHIEIPA